MAIWVHMLHEHSVSASCASTCCASSGRAIGDVMHLWFTTLVNQPQFQAVVGKVDLAKEELLAAGAPAPAKKEKKVRGTFRACSQCQSAVYSWGTLCVVCMHIILYIAQDNAHHIKECDAAAEQPKKEKAKKEKAKKDDDDEPEPLHQ
eukprot:17599-Heterococcus_DN1.PRE.2